MLHKLNYRNKLVQAKIRYSRIRLYTQTTIKFHETLFVAVETEFRPSFPTKIIKYVSNFRSIYGASSRDIVK